MFSVFVKKQLIKNRELILQEVRCMNGFMQLLMKQTNSGDVWSKREIKQLRSCLLRLSLYVPILVIFLLPFGSLILPILAEVLDKREQKRMN
jgi:hypothetical protein